MFVHQIVKLKASLWSHMKWNAFLSPVFSTVDSNIMQELCHQIALKLDFSELQRAATRKQNQEKNKGTLWRLQGNVDIIPGFGILWEYLGRRLTSSRISSWNTFILKLRSESEQVCSFKSFLLRLLWFEWAARLWKWKNMWLWRGELEDYIPAYVLYFTHQDSSALRFVKVHWSLRCTERSEMRRRRLVWVCVWSQNQRCVKVWWQETLFILQQSKAQQVVPTGITRHCGRLFPERCVVTGLCTAHPSTWKIHAVEINF